MKKNHSTGKKDYATYKKDYDPIINKLPANFRENREFLEPFLRAFEELLLGLPVDVPEEEKLAYAKSRGTLKSIRQILHMQADYFHAFKTPPQFLEWLAGWVGYDFRRGEEFNHPDDNVESLYESPTRQHIPLEDDRVSFNRFFISRMVSVYRDRGTKTGIKQIIDDYLENINYLDLDLDQNPDYSFLDYVEVRIDEYLEPFILGSENSSLGQHSILGIPRPHYFRIVILTRELDAGMREKIKQDIVRILDEEKPAHVIYYITIEDIDDYLTSDIDEESGDE